jgi:hypothetical protein
MQEPRGGNDEPFVRWIPIVVPLVVLLVLALVLFVDVF